MLQRCFSFLVVFLLMFSGDILGQISFKPKQFIKAAAKSNVSAIQFKQNSSFNYCTTAACNCLGQTKPPVKFSLQDFMSKNYFDAKLGIFCKKELQLEKLTNIAFRFRLGSLDYVNWMEGKPNAIKPN